jgi:CubicO group peptidase (beta-lactamase class C family)
MKSFRYLLIIVFGLLFHSVNGQQKDDAQLVVEFDKILAEQINTIVPGATALVVRKGQVIYQKALGMANLELNVPMQLDHVFRIGSIGKQFTAVVILQLMEQGKLHVQDDITKYIPDYPTQGHKITIEHLLTHTSGIQCFTRMKDYMERMTLDVTPTEMIDHFKNEPMNFDPGTKWNYSNSGYFILGYIIEKVSGLTYQEYLETNIFKPLGLTNTYYGSDSRIIRNRVGTYSESEHGFVNAMPLSMTQPYAAGSIQSTVEDLYKWHEGLMDYKLVSKTSLDKAFTRYTLADGTETDYGYGWRFGYVQESPSIEHGGAINGSQSMAIYLPKEDVYVAVLANCDCISLKDIAARLSALAINSPYEAKEIVLDHTLLQGYTGVYENESGEQRMISLSEDGLYSQRGRNPKFSIKAYKPDRFFFEDGLLTIEFARNANGEIEKLITHSRTGNEVWNKTDKPFMTQSEIKVDEEILNRYVGEYEITPDFSFLVTQEQDRLFLQATGQEKIELFAETETKFFLKVNDAQLEFVSGDSGDIAKAILNQGGRTADAKKVK